MIGKLVMSDLLKMRRTGIWWVVWIGALGLTGMQALNFGLRYDYLVRDVYADDPWRGLISSNAMFVPIAIYLAMTLLMSMIANIEHKQNAWKQTLALPVRRSQVFASKFICSFIQLLAACVILSVSTGVLGLLLQLQGPIPYLELLTFGFYPMLASLPMLGMMLWMTLSVRNQAIPITLGIAASLISMFGAVLPDQIPIAWPSLVVRGESTFTLIGLGIAIFAALYLLGSIHFSRKDVA
ncbi:ABC transporter permease [Saccharibacillus sp. JS10]|uniref:ABC transporter permease n=1 Tax=Saccharibacillus sp. JS10 TaxID=2950552 RepID=UPI002109D4B3|nr:ABC transporter permease [Saccharibacillus sp. JS10]MCQ4087432.1 ABC transporter permease [Saccharibacillus sp. JS10]